MPLTIQAVTLDRLTYHSRISFEVAEGRLRSSIQKVQSQSSKKVPASRPTTKESFGASLLPQLGPHGFKHFAEFNHGSWLSLYKPATSTLTATTTRDISTAAPETTVKVTEKNLRAIRFILGNPLIALTMLRHDLDAGLSVPVELYLVEEVAPGGDGATGARIVWYRPSGLVAGYEGATTELVEAAKVLDVKLEALVRWVLDENEIENGNDVGNEIEKGVVGVGKL